MARERGVSSSRVEKAHSDSEVGEHGLKARDILGGSIEVGGRPKLVTHDLLPLPTEGLNKPESEFGMGTPHPVDDRIAFRPGVIDLLKQVEDNFLRRHVFDVDLCERT